MTNTPPFDRLTRAQRTALISIVSGDEPKRTASLADVSPRTLRNWRKLPAFQEALAEARRDFFSACRSHLNASLAVAFRSVMGSADHSWVDSDRLKAALFLLDRVENSGMSAVPLPQNDATNKESITESQNTRGKKRQPGANRGNRGQIAAIGGAKRKLPATRGNKSPPVSKPQTYLWAMWGGGPPASSSVSSGAS